VPVAGWDTVREIALSLPEAEEDSGERLAFRIRGKLFAWQARDRDGGGLAVRVEREEKELMLDGGGPYFTSPHYDGYPAVQIRVDEIDERELRERIEDAWLIQAPKHLATSYVTARGD
jgi:hypothetical protein